MLGRRGRRRRGRLPPRARGRTAPRRPMPRRRSGRRRAPRRTWRSHTTSAGTSTGCRRIGQGWHPWQRVGRKRRCARQNSLFGLGRCDRPAEGDRTERGRPAQAGAHVQGGYLHCTGQVPDSPSVPCPHSYSPSRRRPRFTTSGRGARSDRLANPTTPLRAVGAVRVVAHRRARRGRPRRHVVRHRRLAHHSHTSRHVHRRVVRRPDRRTQGRGMPPHRRRVRTRRRVRPHPQRIRLPARSPTAASSTRR